MKKYLLTFIFICFVLFPGKAYARCSDVEFGKLQKIAANISYSTVYREENGKVVFDITLTNVTNDVYLYDFIGRRNIYGSNNPITLYGYNSGATINYTVRSNSNNCRGETLRTILVTLPSYNPYYTDELCEGISSYSLCNRWYNTQNLSYEDFEKQVKNYRKKLEAVEEPVEEPEEQPTWQSILINMFTKYYVFILVPIIIIAGGSIYILKKNEEII